MPKIKTLEQAISANEPVLSVIKKQEGEAPAVAMLVIMINALASFFSVGKTMNDCQVIETAKLLLSEFYFLKISDLQLFFTQIKTGFYGNTFDRIDGNVIMVHLRTYCDERINCAENLSLEKHKQLMALDGEDKYIISNGNDFIVQTNNEFGITAIREDATRYTFSEAIQAKTFLLKHYNNENELKIVRPIKAIQGLIDYIKENKPEWVPDKIREDKLDELKRKRLAIERNENLNPFEKRNAINLLYGFKTMTIDEFREEQEALKNKS